VVEIRSADRTALLARLSAVLERDGLNIVWARVATLGSSVIDVFGILVPALTAGDGTGEQSAARRTRALPTITGLAD
jgi:[protein-PII] uridylyltransferase